MQPPATAAAKPEKRSRLTLWLILGVCAAPLIASYALFYWGRPAGQVNYGDLLEPRPIGEIKLIAPDGRSLALSELRGQWVLLTINATTCAQRCRQKLVYMRQVRLAVGKESDRIERLWLLAGTGAPDPKLLAEHPGVLVARDPSGALASLLPAEQAPSEHIYVIDPLGNLMMRFPADPDPRRMLKDVSRLLRHSKWK
ncbi:MAG TPA: cytochrome C oxidase subunit I [Burkholderiales bacterium]|nr:cytochrome C oxidase subunit I [Burkholderiales bacterium]